MTNVFTSIYYGVIDACAFLAVLPYGSLYRRNTRAYIVSIITKDEPESLKTALDCWFRIKTREAQYVQIAGALLFASMLSCLSWSNLSNVNWSGPALWYAGIVFALVSVVLGAQQTMIMPSEKVDTDTAIRIRKHLVRDEAGEKKPSRTMLFVWQAPLMCLSYAVVCFLAGLTSVVISPFAMHPAWDDQAKTVVVYLAAALIASITFVRTSFRVHSLLRQ